MSDWHTRLQRPQHLASALGALGHTCCFLNPHLGRQFPGVYLFNKQPRLASITPGVFEAHVRLPSEPVYHHRQLRDSETALLADTLGELAAVAADSVIQVVAFPAWGPVALELRRRHGWPILYDCHDFLAGFENVAPELVAAEAPLMNRCDHVVYSSLWLQEHLSPRVTINPAHTSLLRNAVKSSFLKEGQGRRKPVSGKTAGYIGALDSWFDIEAVRRAAELHPQVQFCLVGRVEFSRVRELQRLPNIAFAGEVPFDALPNFLRNFDIGMIPFQVNDLTRGADPIKLYEYFSAGLPVVSTRLPEVERFRDLVYIADDAAEFARLVGAALQENDEERRAQRIEAAAGETWECRASCLLSVAEGLLRDRAGSR
jgi:O-antigen biosynthesis protein